jgi:2,4-dienoyl-CoA reductase-like NADH-dependent reductase (Old Yellow Enzyme family)
VGEIFSPWNIGQLQLGNRLVRSATWEGMAQEDGAPSQRLFELTTELARGGVGLILMGYSYVDPEGLGMPRQTGIHDDGVIEPWKKLVDAVHDAGTRVATQIVHAGGSTVANWMPGRTQIFGPSALTDPVFGAQVEALTKEHIGRIVAAFAAAAERSLKAGFDAIQLHGAHGYLISQFLSPERNQRDDEYGGSLANRARFLREVYEAVREVVGPDYPLFIKINGTDATDRGFTLDEAVEVARKLDEMGIDAIEVSGGVPAARPKGTARAVKTPEEEGYFLKEAEAIKAAVSCPVISVGGWRSRGKVEGALDAVDAVALSRPLIRQPDLVNLWKEGSRDDPTCVSCNGCMELGVQSGVACVKDLKKDGE